MPTGSRPTNLPVQRGFTYLLLLLALAIGGAGLAALGTQWRTTVQRDREEELLFRGGEIAKAISSYRFALKDRPQWPRSFADLLQDGRGGDLRRHLRRLYTDPFTGKADWVLASTEDGGFSGVSSRSEMRAYITRGMEAAALPAITTTGADAHSASAHKPASVAQHFFGVAASGTPIQVSPMPP